MRRVTSRARTGANVARKRVTSAPRCVTCASRSTISASLSSSPRIPRATARLAPALGERRAVGEPRSRRSERRRSAARTRARPSARRAARSRSIARTTSAVSASSRSPVDLREGGHSRRGERRLAVDAARACRAGSAAPSSVGVELVTEHAPARRTGWHRGPTTRHRPRMSCPGRSSARCAAPSPTTTDERARARGPPASLRAPATSQRSNQRDRGCSPSRPPAPAPVWNPIMIPMRDGGMPSARSVAADCRYRTRSRREPSIGPSRQMRFAFA